MSTKTEAQLKQDCTPEIIKKMVELAEGFEWEAKGKHLKHDKTGCIDFIDRIVNNNLLFPLLIHRVAEGWNKNHAGDPYLEIDDSSVWILSFKSDFKEVSFEFADYQKDSLTVGECALLDCLNGVLK